jgi:Type II secretion system (T2SS), protein E, N-terminal domain
VSDTPGEAAIILVPTPERLRDYFRRLGAEASVTEDGSVRVELVGHGGVDDTIADHLRHWQSVNGVMAAAQVDPPSPVHVPPQTETPAGGGSYFLERPRLGDLLARKGLVTTEQLDLALAESKATGDLLGRVMIRRRFIFGDELARTLADQLDIPYANLRVTGYERSVAAMIPSALGMARGVLPIGVLGGRIRIAFADPTDEEAIAAVRAYVGDFTLAVADLLEIELAWKTLDPTCAGDQVA